MGVPTFLETGHMTEGFPIRVIHTGDQFDYAAHWHEEIELVYVEGASARIGVYNHIHELKQGDLLLIKPGDVHYFLPGTQRLTIVLFRLELLTGGSFNENDLSVIKNLFNKTAVIPAAESREREVAEYINALTAEERNRGKGFKWAMMARLFDLLVHLFRTQMPREDSQSDHLQIPCCVKKFEYIEAVCAYLEEHYSEPVKLEDAAEHIKFSKFYVCKLFKEIKGMTLMEYLNHLRIIKSEWALLFSEASILSIAVSHGFSNINTYNRLFKKYNGCTPSEFRKKHKSNSTTYEGC